MANENIRTASNSLQRAAQDMQIERKDLERDLQASKDNANSRIRDIQAEMTGLDAIVNNRDVPEVEKVAARAQQQNLRSEADDINRNLAQYDRDTH